MKTRIGSMIPVVLLLATSTGCSGVRNALFGQGARCGLCSTFRLGNTMPTPAEQPCCPPQNPWYPSCGTAAPGGPATVAPNCGSCGPVYSAMPSDCGCSVGAYSGQPVDPYLQGTVYPSQSSIPGGMPQLAPGESLVPNSFSTGGMVPGAAVPGYGAPTPQPYSSVDDGFGPRSLDANGNGSVNNSLPSGGRSL